jgi:hypothetical protein
VPVGAAGVSEDRIARWLPLLVPRPHEIAQSLFIGAENLVMEGTSDLTYLTVIVDYLKEKGRTYLDPSIRPVPTGGASNIPAFVALFGQHLKMICLSTRVGQLRGSMTW